MTSVVHYAPHDDSGSRILVLRDTWVSSRIPDPGPNTFTFSRSCKVVRHTARYLVVLSDSTQKTAHAKTFQSAREAAPSTQSSHIHRSPLRELGLGLSLCGTTGRSARVVSTQKLEAPRRGGTTRSLPVRCLGVRPRAVAHSCPRASRSKTTIALGLPRRSHLLAPPSCYNYYYYNCVSGKAGST